MAAETLVLFDIDGTLVRCDGLGRRAIEATFAEVWGWPHALRGVALDGRTDRTILAEVFARQGAVQPRGALATFAEVYLGHLGSMIETYREGRLLPGVRELLDRLVGRKDLKLGLLTGNLSQSARMKLSLFGLMDYFAFGAYGEDGDEATQRSDLLPIAVARSGLPPTVPVVVVGDTPADIEVARRHRARAVAVATGSSHRREDLAPHAPDALLDDLAGDFEGAAGLTVD